MNTRNSSPRKAGNNPAIIITYPSAPCVCVPIRNDTQSCMVLSILSLLFMMLPHYSPCSIMVKNRRHIMTDELMTTEEIAQELKYHIETVRKWIREGKLKATRINRKEYRVRRSELERFLAGKQ